MPLLVEPTNCGYNFTFMRLVLMLFVMLLVMGCGTVSNDDRNFFYNGWFNSQTNQNNNPVPPLDYYENRH